jgi:hypothetical protein
LPGPDGDLNTGDDILVEGGVDGVVGDLDDSYTKAGPDG